MAKQKTATWNATELTALANQHFLPGCWDVATRISLFGVVAQPLVADIRVDITLGYAWTN
jgi:hypothetical protein